MVEQVRTLGDSTGNWPKTQVDVQVPKEPGGFWVDSAVMVCFSNTGCGGRDLLSIGAIF